MVDERRGIDHFSLAQRRCDVERNATRVYLCGHRSCDFRACTGATYDNIQTRLEAWSRTSVPDPRYDPKIAVWIPAS